MYCISMYIYIYMYYIYHKNSYFFFNHWKLLRYFSIYTDSQVQQIEYSVMSSVGSNAGHS